MTQLVKIYKCEYCGRTCRIRIEGDKNWAADPFKEKFVYHFEPKNSCIFFPTTAGRKSMFELEMDFEE